MACVNADGSLTPVAHKVLSAMLEPRVALEIQQIAGIPLYRVRASLRELMGLGFVTQTDEQYQITESGKERLNQ